MKLGEWYKREYGDAFDVSVLDSPKVMRKWAEYLEFQKVSADFADIHQLQKLWERTEQTKEMGNG